MIIKLEPMDNLMFRTPAPFNAGEDDNADSIFPPYSQTYAGIALANGIFSKSEKLAKRFKIGISGILLDNKPLFVQPLDLFREENTNQAFYHHIERAPISNYPLPYITGEYDIGGTIIRNANSYMPLSEIQSYLNAGSICGEYHKGEDLYKTETHVGIEIDSTTRAVKKKRIYQRKMIRLCKKDEHNAYSDVSLFFEAKGVDFEDQSVVRLGGRDKNAVLSTIDTKCSIAVPSNMEKYFKIYLVTHAIFKKGWLPKWIRMNGKGFYDGVFTYKGQCVKVKLLAASVGGYVPIGGFGSGSYAKPKEMNYAVPAGSVYYFKLLEGKMKDVDKLFHERCLSDYRENLSFDYENWDRMRYCDRGYGYALVGKLTEEQIKYLDRSEK